MDCPGPSSSKNKVFEEREEEVSEEINHQVTVPIKTKFKFVMDKNIYNSHDLNLRLYNSRIESVLFNGTYRDDEELHFLMAVDFEKKVELKSIFAILKESEEGIADFFSIRFVLENYLDPFYYQCQNVLDIQPDEKIPDNLTFRFKDIHLFYTEETKFKTTCDKVCEKYSDLEINVRGIIFKAHKIIIANYSEALKKIIDTEIIENQIKLDDVDYKTFIEIRKYLYTNECNLTEKNVHKILLFAHKYKIISLKNYCQFFMNYNDIQFDESKLDQIIHALEQTRIRFANLAINRLKK